MEIGERWAYRARGVDPLVEVEVVRIGTGKPARVRMRFVDDRFEGREDWVPPARLKVRWSDKAAFEERESRWNAVIAASNKRDTPEGDAAIHIFEDLIDYDLAGFGYNRTEGVTMIKDVDGLAAFLQLDSDQLRSHPLSFLDDGALVVPWPITELIVKRAAELHADQVLVHVEKEEAERRLEMTFGRYVEPSQGRPGFRIEPEEIARWDEEESYGRRFRELLRAWCGTAAAERRDELSALRDEVQRLGRLVADSANELRRLGATREATRIERELGLPAEQIRLLANYQDRRRSPGG